MSIEYVQNLRNSIRKNDKDEFLSLWGKLTEPLEDEKHRIIGDISSLLEHNKEFIGFNSLVIPKWLFEGYSPSLPKPIKVDPLMRFFKNELQRIANDYDLEIRVTYEVLSILTLRIHLSRADNILEARARDYLKSKSEEILSKILSSSVFNPIEISSSILLERSGSGWIFVETPFRIYF
jgi:hypothetical protein